MDSRLVFRRDRVILNQRTKRNDRSFKWFPKNVSRMEFSLQTRDLECFADKQNIPWNLRTNFHPDLIATIRQRCLPLLCALLFPQSHLFLICVVLTYNDSRKYLHKLCKFQRIISVNDFKLPIRLQELLQAPLCLLRSFCFARIRLNPLGCQVLHDGSFTENFEICCCQVTKIFCTKYDSANTSSARGLVILVLRQISQFRSLGK